MELSDGSVVSLKVVSMIIHIDRVVDFSGLNPIIIVIISNLFAVAEISILWCVGISYSECLLA